MYYIYSTGVRTLAPNTAVNLSSIAEMYTTYPIQVNRLVLSAQMSAGDINNVLVNWRPSTTSKWYFHEDVPLRHLFSSPQFPFWLNSPIQLYQNYLELILQNNDLAGTLTYCIAFFGIIGIDRATQIKVDKKSKRSYVYPINIPGPNSILANGVVIMPAAVPPAPFTDTVRLQNTYDDVFDIKKMWQWPTTPWDTTVIFRLDSVSVPLINQATFMSQIFGTADLPTFLHPEHTMEFDGRTFREEIQLDLSESLVINLSHNQIAPVAPFSISPVFDGHLYRHGKD